MSNILNNLVTTSKRSTVETLIAEVTNQLQLNYPIETNGQFNQANADANAAWQDILFNSQLNQGQDYIETIAASEDAHHHYPNYIQNCKQMFDLGAYHWFIVDEVTNHVKIATIEDIKRLVQSSDIIADPDGENVQQWDEIADATSDTLCNQLGI